MAEGGAEPLRARAAFRSQRDARQRPGFPVTAAKQRPGFPSLEESANLPPRRNAVSEARPGFPIIAADIVEDVQAALVQFAEIAADLKQ